MTKWQWEVIQALIRVVLHHITTELYGGVKMRQDDIGLLEEALARDAYKAEHL